MQPISTKIRYPIAFCALILFAFTSAQSEQQPAKDILRLRLNELKARPEFGTLFEALSLAYKEFANKKKIKTFHPKYEDEAVGIAILRSQRRNGGKGSSREANFKAFFDENILEPCETIMKLNAEYKDNVDYMVGRSVGADRMDKAAKFCDFATDKLSRQVCFEQYKMELRDMTMF